MSTNFIYRYISDFWKLLGYQDRQFFSNYWEGLVQIAGDLITQAFYAGTSHTVEGISPYRPSRWNRFHVVDIPELDGFNTVSSATNTEVVKSLELLSETIYSLADKAILSGTVAATSDIRELKEDTDFTIDYYNATIKRTSNSRIVSIEGTDGALIGDTFTTSEYLRSVRKGTKLIITTANDGKYNKGKIFTVKKSAGVLTLKESADIDEIDLEFQLVEPMVLTFTHNKTEYPYAASGTTGYIPALDKMNIFSDTRKFTDAKPGFTLNITAIDGNTLHVLVGQYTIRKVLNHSQLEINGEFESSVHKAEYNITNDAYKYVAEIDTNIVSIPKLQNLIKDPDIMLLEDVDYIVNAGRLAFREEPDVLWSEVTLLNNNHIFKNFGLLIDYVGDDSPEYLRAVRGLWYIFYHGPSKQNVLTGLYIITGLANSQAGGTVIFINDIEIKVKDFNGVTYSHAILDGLSPLVKVNDTVTLYQPLVTGIQLIDKLDDPNFVENRMGRDVIRRYLTDAASLGTLPTSDETKALHRISEHLWMIEMDTAAGEVIDITDVSNFISQIRPLYTAVITAFRAAEPEVETMGSPAWNASAAEGELTRALGGQIDVSSFDLTARLHHPDPGNISHPAQFLTAQVGDKAYVYYPDDENVNRIYTITEVTQWYLDAEFEYEGPDFAVGEINCNFTVYREVEPDSDIYFVDRFISKVKVDCTKTIQSASEDVKAWGNGQFNDDIITDPTASFMDADVDSSDRVIIYDDASHDGEYPLSGPLSDTELLIEADVVGNNTGKYIVGTQDAFIGTGHLFFHDEFELHQQVIESITGIIVDSGVPEYEYILNDAFIDPDPSTNFQNGPVPINSLIEIYDGPNSGRYARVIAVLAYNVLGINHIGLPTAPSLAGAAGYKIHAKKI